MTTDRLLPLGEAADGAWIAERAAGAALTAAARGVRGVVPERPRFRLAEHRAGDGGGGNSPDSPDAPDAPDAHPVPPSGLPPAPLRITLDLAAVAGRPLPELADRVRAALLDTAEGALGLVVAEVDLRVTDLLDTLPEFTAPDGPAGESRRPLPTIPPRSRPSRYRAWPP
ncbi:hypothetical protein RGF97_26815 [Streptomyces roseicoloratus]|uniref:Nucleopolyhedrovirus P10 family protein n=1 Tax=Streptomyces roseicoloratus TaxID=2508722 RepID=A0ABY9RZU1_9ACTN|nr:hypothetical protein [Streptomyces roseicoloratus]WMX47697.1 hypothetical protein RGF97_26815 [Streptomyces roseicoloratus]